MPTLPLAGSATLSLSLATVNLMTNRNWIFGNEPTAYRGLTTDTIYRFSARQVEDPDGRISVMGEYAVLGQWDGEIRRADPSTNDHWEQDTHG